MNKSCKAKPYIWIIFLTKIVLFACLFGFMSIWVNFGSNVGILSQVGFQRTRIERLTKDVLILGYTHPSAIVIAQAVSEMQNALPLWRKTQAGLQSGDASLGLPRPDPTIQEAVINAQVNYIPLASSFQNILNHSQTIDPIQVQIVLNNENEYLTSMSQVDVLWQQQIQSIFQQIYIIEGIVILFILFLVVSNFIVVYPYTNKKGEVLVQEPLPSITPK